MIVPIRGFVDANVLVSTWVTDVVLTLAERGLAEPRWSSAVLAEAEEAFVRMRRGKAWAGRYLSQVDAAVPFACVEIDEADLERIELPGPDDRHVVAAALASGCALVVTYNLKDFPDEALAPLGLRAIHPDEFLMQAAQSAPDAVAEAVRSLTLAKRHPPRSMSEEIEGLRKTRLAKFADFIEGRVD